MSSATFRIGTRTAWRIAAAVLFDTSASFIVHADDGSGPVSPADLRTVLFGSIDGGTSNFGTLGFKRTLRGPLDVSGPVMMGSAGYGGRFERAEAPAGAPRILRRTVLGSATLGYQWTFDGVVLAAFAGPELEVEQEGRDGVAGSKDPIGARLHGEVWAHPTSDTLATATLIAGTAGDRHLWGRTSFGYKIWENVFVGPEASVYTTDTYREWRVGAHLTGLTLGGFKLGLSAGWRADDDRRDGAYVGISGHLRM